MYSNFSQNPFTFLIVNLKPTVILPVCQKISIFTFLIVNLKRVVNRSIVVKNNRFTFLIVNLKLNNSVRIRDCNKVIYIPYS